LTTYRKSCRLQHWCAQLGNRQALRNFGGGSTGSAAQLPFYTINNAAHSGGLVRGVRACSYVAAHTKTHVAAANINSWQYALSAKLDFTALALHAVPPAVYLLRTAVSAPKAMH